jgi:phospholipase C
MTSADIEHVIVLALENRSFDHMLGYLDPALDEDGLGNGVGYTNPGWDGAPVAASAGAKRVLPADPDHSHDAVMEQLAIRGIGAGRHATNQGFVTSYERKGRGLAPPHFGGLFGPLINWWNGLHDPAKVKDRGPLIMLCHDPKQVPVLSTLASQFAVCTRWFCSVPGETWPNRNFLHAATSDGETGIELRPYYDRTIFEVLEDKGKSWHVYHEDTPQVWAFPRLWDSPERHAKWFPVGDFAKHVATGRLPNYSFIEPNHKPPLHTLDHLSPFEADCVSSSQHPGNNTVTDADYDEFPETTDTDFARGEILIATIYEALRAHPAVFERSLLLITYDEHGGFFDHVPPPMNVPNPGDPPSRFRLLRRLWHRKAAAFDFTMLGPRVPAVVISPYIPAGTRDRQVRDHASVPATLRAIFAPDADPLTSRDAWAPPFHTTLTLDEPRRDDLPDLSELPDQAASHDAPESLAPDVVAAATSTPADADADASASRESIPDFYMDFAMQGELVQEKLVEVAEPEILKLPAVDPQSPQRPTDISRAFMEAARRHREHPHDSE